MNRDCVARDGFCDLSGDSRGLQDCFRKRRRGPQNSRAHLGKHPRRFQSRLLQKYTEHLSQTLKTALSEETFRVALKFTAETTLPEFVG